MTMQKAVTADGKVIDVPFLKGSTPPAKPDTDDKNDGYARAPAGPGFTPAQRGKA